MNALPSGHALRRHRLEIKWPFDSETTLLFRELIPDRTLRWAAYLVIWLLVAVGASLIAMAARPNSSFLLQFKLNVVLWGFWLLWATPSILSLANRFPIRGAGARRGFAIHLGSCVAHVAALLSVSATANIVIVQCQSFSDFPRILRRFGLFEASYFALSYGMVVAMEHAVVGYRRDLQLRQKAGRLRVEAVTAQLEALSARLRPHFLFNMLNTISSRIATGRHEEAREMIAQLGEILREGLRYEPDEMIRLADEIEGVRRYLQLFSARFGGALTTRIECEERALAALVPNLILQPIAENSFKHGTGAGGNPSILRITASVIGSTLEIRIIATTDGEPGRPADPGMGIGLRDTHRRLGLLYGKSYSLTIDSGRDGENVTILRLPIELDQGGASG